MPTAVNEKFSRALEALVEKVKGDRSILAAILCGSLSHDTVWDKSDIDLVLVAEDEKAIRECGLSLYADGINVHALTISRSSFRRKVEGSLRNSFMHSFLAKGRLLYTHDPTIAGLCEQLQATGARDLKVQLLNAASAALPAVYKAHKWLRTRGDLEYTALWILYAANELARIEVLSAGQVADREVIPQAVKLNPDFFRVVYTEMLNGRKTAKNVAAALGAVDAYIAGRTDELFGMVLEYLKEVGEARSATEIEDHFQRNFGLRGVTGACEYLADRGLIGKAPLPARLTRKSNVDVEEVAFFYSARPDALEEAPDEW